MQHFKIGSTTFENKLMNIRTNKNFKNIHKGVYWNFQFILTYLEVSTLSCFFRTV